MNKTFLLPSYPAIFTIDVAYDHFSWVSDVKNENWFQLLNRGCFSILVHSSLKALFMCQQIITKDLLQDLTLK